VILTASLLAEVLADLAARVASTGSNVTVHVVGGAAIAIGVHPQRDATQDVDVWLNTDATGRRVVEEVAARIADERGWSRSWLNEEARGFIPESVGGKGSPDWQPYCAIDDVAVVVAHPRILFAMKLHAARGRRDFPDLAVLAGPAGIDSAATASALFEEYFPYDELKPRAREWLAAFFGGEAAG
jgi:hypothetical protein